MADARRRSPARPPSRIPEFASREEEADFWDTHDISDYWDELQPVDVCFAKDLASESTRAPPRRVRRGA